MILGLGALLLASQAMAQRPAPPRGWTIDTTSGVPVAVRRGGLLSTETRAELLGPMRREEPALQAWFVAFARADAATLGALDPAARDDINVGTIAGKQVIVAGQSVQTPQGTRYVAYGVLQDTPPDEPVIVVRSVFGDALTLVRVFRSSVEALLPYILTPTAAMRERRPTTVAARAPTSFRGAVATPPAEDTVAAAAGPGPASAGDPAARAAVSAMIDDAAAELEGREPARRTSTSRASGGSARSTRSASPSVGATAGSLAAALEKVVFYQFGDLQFHPVALFRDGTSYDIDEAPLELTDGAASRRREVERWGRWRRQGATYYLAESRGPERDYTLGSGFHTGFAMPAGATLDGTYKAVTGTTMGETSTLFTGRFRFTPDGRFSGGSDFTAVGSGTTSGVTMGGGASRRTSGRYRVSGHRLVLTFDGGEVKELFFAFGSGGEPERLDREMLFVGSTAYVREEP